MPNDKKQFYQESNRFTSHNHVHNPKYNYIYIFMNSFSYRQGPFSFNENGPQNSC